MLFRSEHLFGQDRQRQDEHRPPQVPGEQVTLRRRGPTSFDPSHPAPLRDGLPSRRGRPGARGRSPGKKPTRPGRCRRRRGPTKLTRPSPSSRSRRAAAHSEPRRSEEHTSELQSRTNLVCRLLLEKKKKKKKKKEKKKKKITRKKKNKKRTV